MKTTFLQKLITIFWKQNSWHRHWVLIHTLKVSWRIIKKRKFRMLTAWLLHDIWKPFVSTRDKSKGLSFSFNWHEEKSYQLIKKIPFISKYTKKLVRWHYLIRWTKKAKEKSKDKNRNKEERTFWYNEYIRQRAVWKKLDKNFRKDLKKFIKYDDYWK